MASANLKSKISLDDTQFSAGLRRVRLASAAAGKTIGSGFKKIGTGMAGLVKSLAKFATIAASITFAAAIAGVAKLTKSSLIMASKIEGIEVTMSNFVGGTEQAQKILKDISRFSTVTPFETVGLQETVNLLLGAGIAADDAVPVMKELAAVSKNTGQVSELGDAIAKGFAKGKFQTEELNKFLERGINLMPQLQRVTGLSGDALKSAIQDGLKFDDVREAIARMSQEGGLFYGMLEKQSTTTTGLISTLKSNYDEVLTAFGRPINNALKPLLELSIVKMGSLIGTAEKFGNVVGGFITKISQVDFIGIGQRFIAGLNIDSAKELLLGAMKIVGAFLGNQLLKVIRLAAHFAEVAFNFVFEKISGQFGQKLEDNLLEVAKIAILPPPLQIAKMAEKIKGGLQKASEDGMTLEDKLLEAKDALKNKVLKDPDPFGFNSAVDDFKQNLDSVMFAGAAKIETGSKQDAPSDKTGPTLTGNGHGMVLADSAAGRALQATFENPFAKNKQVGPIMPPTPVSPMQATAMQMSTAAGAGFTGLAGLHGMQLERMAGIAPGSNTTFSRDRARLGIASGLQTGGLGAVRKVGAKADQKQQRKDDTVIGTNERLTTVNDKLQKQNDMLQEALN